MSYSFFSHLLVRTPLYSYAQYAAADYASLLKSSEFQAALYLASKAFYDELEKKHFEYGALNDRQRYTIIKYFNRASFRCTPFGLFSAFSLVDWGNASTGMVVSSAVRPYIQPDFSVLVQMLEKLMHSDTAGQLLFYPNASVYVTDTDIRYVKTDIEQQAQTRFSMVAVSRNVVLKQVLHFCKTGKTLADLRQYLAEHAGADTAGAQEFIKELYEAEIIVPDIRPNVIGRYFRQQLMYYLQRTADDPEANRVINDLADLLQRPEPDAARLAAIATRMTRYLAGTEQQKSFYYAVAERHAVAGALPARYQAQLQEGLHCLISLSREEMPDELEKFKKAFIAKYECGEIPLLEVLDPQLGIGYGDFDTVSDKLGIINDASNTGGRNSSSSSGPRDKDGLAMLLREWQVWTSHATPRELVITDAHLDKVREKDVQSKLPPSISVMFRIAGEQIFFEHAGNCSALSLLGRFSCSEEVAAFGKEIARKEQEMNSGVVFAEISHVCNMHSANINQRDHLREYEIPVLTYAAIAPDKQIPLSDLVVSVVNDTVVLRSKKLKKIVVPRLASAYNYTKSTFPIFRFLCDLQSQQLVSNFSFSLPALAPGLKFYPRVVYKSCVLQVCEWHFGAEDMQYLLAAGSSQQAALFREFAAAHHIPRYFAHTYLDNYIVYDLEKDEDIHFFLREIKNKSSVILKEFPYLHGESHITGEDGQPLLGQYVAMLYQQEDVYRDKVYYRPESVKAVQLRDTSDWLYFKIYCHPLSSDSLLTDHLLPLVEKKLRAGAISDWFWIRYNDPDYHIRLRIRPSKNNHGGCFEAINVLLNRLWTIKLVSSFQTDQYKRETDRYSAELMLDVEKVFGTSSALAGELLKHKHKYEWDEPRVLAEAVVAIRKILACFGYAHQQKADFCKLRFEQFFLEFQSPRTLKPSIEKVHKQIAPLVTALLADKKHGLLYTPLEKNLGMLDRHYRLKKVRSIRLEDLAADMIHMHLNRLFTDRQRNYEMAGYYLAWRSLSSELYRQGAEALSL